MGQMPTAANIALSLILLPCLCSTAFARPVVDATVVPDYDYTQTQKIIFYGDGDFVVLADPFQYPAPVMGALVYKIVLQYVAHFQEIVTPPGEPTHVMDLIMEDEYGERRIGQRLYLGDAWLSDGKSIAYLSAEDYRRLADLLRERYTGTEHYSSERLTFLRRPKAEELPDDWLPEAVSVAEAANRMGLSEYPDHEPGSDISRSGRGADGLPDTDVESVEGEEGDPGSERAKPHTDPVARQSSSHSTSLSEHRFRDEKQSGAAGEESPVAGESDWRHRFFAAIAMMGGLLVWLVIRKPPASI